MADTGIPPPPPGFQLEAAPQGTPPPPPGFELDAVSPDQAVVEAAMRHQASLPANERQAAFSALAPSMQQAIQAHIRADAQTASTPEARAARFQQLQAGNVADMGTVGRFVAGVGEGAHNFWQGVHENLIDRPLDLINPREQTLSDLAAGTPAQTRVQQDQANIAEQRRMAQALNSTASGAIGNVVGGAAESAPLLLIPGGGETALARLGLGAAAGAGYGYLAPSASGSEELGNIAAGAATGPILAGAAKGAQLIGRGVRDVAAPFINTDTPIGAWLAQKTGMSPANVAGNRLGAMLDKAGVSSATLRQGVQDVPGVEPTLAGVVPTSKRVVQLERSLRNNKDTGPEFATRDMQNDRARVAALQQHTQPPLPADTNGTPANMGSVQVFDPETGQMSWQTMDALKAAELQRGANFKNFADNNLAPTTPRERFQSAFDALMNGNPGRMSGADFDKVQSAVKALRLGAQGRLGPTQTIDIFNTIRPESSNATHFLNTAADALNDRLVDPAKTLDTLDALSSHANPIVRRAAAQTRDLITKKAAQDGGDSGMVHAASLNDIRENLGNIVRDASQGDVRGAKQAQALLGPLHDTIVSSIDRKIPGYSQALQDYAQASRPINTAQAVRDFLNPAKNPSLATDAPRVSAAQVKAFLNQKRRFPLSAQATKDATAVQQSIQRAADAQANIGATGSPTAANWASRLGRVAMHVPAYLGGAAIGHMALPGYEGIAAGLGASGAVDAIRQAGEQRVLNELGQLALNPRNAADALDAYLALQGRRQAFNRAILPTNVHGINVLGYLSGISPQVFGPYRTPAPPVPATARTP